MLERLDRPGSKLPPEKLRKTFAGQVTAVYGIMEQSQSITTLYLDYHDVLENPRDAAERIQEFLGQELDLDAMSAVVDPELYRQRKTPSESN